MTRQSRIARAWLLDGAASAALGAVLGLAALVLSAGAMAAIVWALAYYLGGPA